MVPIIRTSPLYPFERRLMLSLMWYFLRDELRVEGLENVPRGGCIVAGNHIATCDPPLIGALIRRHDVHYMAKAEAFHNWKTGWAIAGYNAFPVARHTADRLAIRRSLAVLAQGRVLIMMPEGTRSPDATLQRAEPGVGLIARRSGSPIVPVGVWGSENALPKGATRPRRAEVHVRYGEPVHLPDARMSHQESADWIMEQIAGLIPERYRGVYGRAGAGVGAGAP
ncbi:MAG TPA: lysophospholipid acyltransferase family protein [Candidatus Dormibacteraeota bacterium]